MLVYGLPEHHVDRLGNLIMRQLDALYALREQYPVARLEGYGVVYSACKVGRSWRIVTAILLSIWVGIHSILICAMGGRSSRRLWRNPYASGLTCLGVFLVKQYRCEECGIILKWPEVRVVEDGDHTEHRVCIYCAEEKYSAGESAMVSD